LIQLGSFYYLRIFKIIQNLGLNRWKRFQRKTKEGPEKINAI
jgi:hypothetical protein